MLTKRQVSGKKKVKPKTMGTKSVETYMPLVYSIASMISGKGLPPGIDYNDLVSDGTVGLMKAWERFDPQRGVKFETYASYRIRGEILDGLKHYNPVPYRIQVMIRDFAKRGRAALLPEEEEIKPEEAKLLEKKRLTEEEFKVAATKIQKIVAASALMYLLSLQAVEEKAEVAIPGEKTPADELEFAELRKRLRTCIEELPKLEKRVVELFYKRELTQREIAKRLKLSRSKVNRVLGKAINRIKEKLKGGRGY